jgi:hypothetical protein
MTRCLDCGSQRTSDQCPVCGLTYAAAELVFRKRLLRQMAVFLAGSLVFTYISGVYPPLDLDAMLVGFGLLFFVSLALAIFLDRRAHARKEIEVLKHLFTGLIPVPFILSVVLFLNGKLDSSQNVVYHPATIEGQYYMHGMVRGSRRLFVYSWREGRKFERLAVDTDDYDRFKRGDQVNVGVAPGALKIPWFYGVYRASVPEEPPPADSRMESSEPGSSSHPSTKPASPQR